MRLRVEHVDRVAILAIAAFVCFLLWECASSLGDNLGSTATLEFTSRFGTHHVLMQLGTVEQREAAIQRHIDDFLALTKAIERIP